MLACNAPSNNIDNSDAAMTMASPTTTAEQLRSGTENAIKNCVIVVTMLSLQLLLLCLCLEWHHSDKDGTRSTRGTVTMTVGVTMTMTTLCDSPLLSCLIVFDCKVAIENLINVATLPLQFQFVCSCDGQHHSEKVGQHSTTTSPRHHQQQQ